MRQPEPALTAQRHTDRAVRPARWIPLAAAGAVLVAAGASLLGLAAAAQQHAPQPTAAQAGVIAPAGAAGSVAIPHPAAARLAWPTALDRAASTDHPPTGAGSVPARARPVSISIPAIGVRSRLLDVGLGPGHTIEVPPLDDPPLTNEAAWYRYSPTPGRAGASIILGHVDSAAEGPSVFYRLGALRPGDRVRVTLTSHQVAVFGVTAVRQYAKTRFPTHLVYGATRYPALRLITCGGSFDPVSHSYLANVVAFASLLSLHPPDPGGRP